MIFRFSRKYRSLNNKLIICYNTFEIIMDWNRRWAKERFLPSLAWHKAWAENVKQVVESAWEAWIKYLTLWALSTDNLTKRAPEEVKWIIQLINNIESFLWEILEQGLKFETIWNISKLPEESQKILIKVKDKTKNNTWLTLIIALIYWGQDEIIRWIKKFILEWWDTNNFDESNFRQYLDTWLYPPVDLIVRTWWDIRTSGFLLYDSPYSEYYFTNKKWPEFNNDEFNKAIDFYDNSKRNFWK